MSALSYGNRSSGARWYIPGFIHYEVGGYGRSVPGIWRRYRIHLLREAKGPEEEAKNTILNNRPLIAAGTTLGIALGGFFDGILFHQILQVHNMLSNWIPRTTLVNEEINMFWDGLFHAFCYIATLAGLLMLWTSVKRGDVALSGETFSGSLLLGWGLFNLIEGLIDHELLQVHHVYQNDPHQFLVWDLLFLAQARC
ncbi:MAG: DUF2243 domain-containing protein [Bryobacteraceae bacterium]